MTTDWTPLDWDKIDLSKIDWSTGFEEIPEEELLQGSAYRPRSKSHTAAAPAENTWPVLGAAACYGLAGDVVKILEPHTEADPAALLIQYLTYFGNCIGRGPHMLLDGAKHFTNLFAVVAGATAKSRKGTSAERVRRIFETAGQSWIGGGRITSGMSSGEGAIWAVRDPVTAYDKKTKTLEIVDPGIDDKRLLFDEREFYQVIAVQKREGNTLSPVLRDAWDGREVLRSLTKHSKAEATGAMISIVGHITIEELRQQLDPGSIRNGFINRFLFVCARRCRLLPRGGGEAATSEFIRRTAEAVTAAQTIGCMQWTLRSGEMWDEAYTTKLSTDHPGLFGAVIARAEPQTVRLAMLYALIDGSVTIRCRHLKAALAVWDYCEASARFIFGSMTGDPVADVILRALREAGPVGMNRTSIRDQFGRHAPVTLIELALQKLRADNKARCEKRPAAAQGRPSEWWFAVDEGT